jgi:hypothetical protein
MAFPVSEDKIVYAETVLGRRLPELLRSRLLRDNGGDLITDDDDWILHPVRDDSDRKRLSRTANDIVTETKVALRWSGFPSDGIAMASNGSGNLLVLMPDSDDVFFWDHEDNTLTSAVVDWS